MGILRSLSMAGYGEMLRWILFLFLLFLVWSVTGCDQQSAQHTVSGRDQLETGPPRSASTQSKDSKIPNVYEYVISNINKNVDDELFRSEVYDWLDYPRKSGTLKATKADLLSIEKAIFFDATHFQLDSKIKGTISKSGKVKYLRIASDVTESQLEWVFQLEKLEGITLVGVELSNEDITKLSNLKNLEWLSLKSVKPEEISSVLPPLPKLRWLSLSSTDGFCNSQSFENFPELSGLFLNQARISSGTILKLSKSNPRLEVLSLFHCHIENVQHFDGFKELVYLNLALTNVRYDKELSTILPNCYINRSD